jgi:dienelactone hydrolase
MTPVLLLAAAVAAPPDRFPLGPTWGDRAIQTYLDAQVRELDATFADGAKSKADWEAKRPRLKEQFLDMLGLWPLPERTPLRPVVTGTLDRGDHVIEKLHFQSRPGLYVTGNLYRPKDVPAGTKLPAILYVCGHSQMGRDGNKTGYQDHGVWFARHGYVCLVIDTLQLGEVAGVHHGTHHLGRWWWLDRGYTPAGVECWNGVRALDYLCSRPDVDATRLGVTGRSGGGATTVWVAAADDRVKVAVPVSGFSDLTCHVSERVVGGHCDCMYPINTYRWDLTTILALVAPRPMLFANSDADPIFPMSGNRRAAAKLRGLYAVLGADGKFDDFDTPGPHKDVPPLRAAAFGFLNRHLKGETGPVGDVEFPKLDPKELRVFPTDADLPRDAINGRADETFVPTAEVTLPTAEGFAGWKAGLVKRLRERSFRSLAAADSSDLFHPTCDTPMLSPGLMGTEIVLNPNEVGKVEYEVWAKRLPNDGLRWAVHTRGGGPGAWTIKNPPNTVERSLALVGQTADMGRVADLIHIIGEGDKVRLVGRGQAGVIAAYAALFTRGSVEEVVILNPPASHRDGPHFLGIQRVLDIPEALGLLAPDVKLTLIGTKDAAFDKTAAIYKLAGAEGKFKRE